MRYLIRSVKYFALLCVLYAAIMSVLFATGNTAMPPAQTFDVLIHSWRGWTMLAAITALAAAYPLFGFTVRRVEAGIDTHRAQIVNAFRASGFRLAGETEDELRFRAEGALLRLRLLFEDEITVTQYGQWIEIRGIRRGVAYVLYRLNSYLENRRYDA